jgi:hypothetical protein
MALTDRNDSILWWVFPVAILGILLVLIRGPAEVITVGSIGILVLGLPLIGRLGYVAQAPFTFCLPGFRESLRRRCFGTAALMGLGGALFALSLLPQVHKVAEDGDLTHVCLQVACGFLMGMTAALIMGASRLILPRLDWGIALLVLIPLLTIAPAFMLLMDSPVAYSTIAILISAALCVFVWLRLGNRDGLKRGHRMLIADATERRGETAPENATKWWSHHADAVTVPPWAESLFRGWMTSCHYLGAGRYLCGSLYEAFGPWFSYWESILFGIAAAALALGLMGSAIAPSIALLYFVFAYRVIRLPVTSTLVLPGGRKKKCYATLAAALATSLLLLGAAVAVVVLARVGVLLLSGSAAPAADGLAHRVTELAGLLLPCVLAPTTLGIQLTHEEGRITPIVWGLSFASLVLILLWRSTWPDWLGLGLLVAMFVFGWSFFLLALRAACRRWDIGQPRPARND